MANDNPLKQFFRQPALYVKMPTNGRWYSQTEVTMTIDGELPVYGLTAIDEVMLNTPDAMLNGQSLEKVISNCAPDVKNVKKLLLPDLEALFLAIKSATNSGKYDFDRNCPKCEHENNFEINCQTLLDTMSYVDDSDCVINLNDELMVHVKPYSFEMRQLFMQREFEEERTLKAIDATNQELDEFEKAKILGESIERLSKMTFDLVSKSIDRIIMTKQGATVTDPAHISEWLISINKQQADSVMEAVNGLNGIGVNKVIPAQCNECGHEWTETLNFDPVSFFVRR